MIEEVRATGAAIRLIGDGDVAGVIHTTDPDETGIDIYLGIGGAPEGVLAAAALRCIGGQMQGRLQLNTEEKVARAAKMGISDPNKIYSDGRNGARRRAVCRDGCHRWQPAAGRALRNRDAIVTHTIVMRSSSRTVREIKARHQDLAKFD
jgi:fructose-1,6-bisphosphatase II / sedoheptulose-1,7-bisphosphatase